MLVQVKFVRLWKSTHIKNNICLSRNIWNKAIDETKLKWTNVKKEKLVYVDNSAVNNSSKDSYGYSKKGQHCILKRKARVSEKITIVGAHK